jgi:hypothetical protein
LNEGDGFGRVVRTSREVFSVNALPAEQEASESPLEADEDDCFLHLNPKSLALNWIDKQILRYLSGHFKTKN